MTKKKMIEYVYIGERLQQFGGVRQVFKNADRELAEFSKVRGACPGRSYMITADGTISTRPESIPEEDQTVHWDEEDQRCYHAHQTLIRAWRAEKRAQLALKKPHPDLIRAVAILTPFCRGLDRWNIDRLLQWVANEIQKNLRPKKKRRR